MNYTLDSLIDEVGGALNLANPQSIRVSVIRLLRTDFFRQIGYNLVGIPFTQQLPLREGRLEKDEHVLMIQDASFDAYHWEGVTVHNAMGNPPLCYMVYDAYGTTFPYYPFDSIWVRGYRLATEPDGTIRIPMECYAAAHDWLLAKLVPTYPLHPRYADRFGMLNEAKVLIAASRAELVPQGDAADRTQRLFFGLS